MMETPLVIFDLEWNIGYVPYTFNYHGVEQTLRGEIIEIGAVKVDEHGNVLDTFFTRMKPRIFRKLQHHVAKVTGLTQADLDRGEPVARGLRRFMVWCGPGARMAEWGADDVPVLKQNLFLCNQSEAEPTVWYDLQRVFLSQRPRAEGDGMTLESVVTRLGLPTDRPFHDALADALYTADVCRMLDLPRGLAEYPTEDELLREGLCAAEGDYRDFRVFKNLLRREAYRITPEIANVFCPECGAPLQPDEVWLKRGSNTYYSLCQCPACRDGEGAMARGALLKFRLSRSDGLHWSVARVLEIPDDEGLAQWEKQRQRALARQKKKPAGEAAGGAGDAGEA